MTRNFALPGTTQLIHGTGIVVWANAVGDAGVEFTVSSGSGAPPVGTLVNELPSTRCGRTAKSLGRGLRIYLAFKLTPPEALTTGWPTQARFWLEWGSSQYAPGNSVAFSPLSAI